MSERKENVAHVAQRELDRILSLPYSQVRLLTMPVHSTVTDNPDYYVNNVAGGQNTFRWNRNNALTAEPLLVGGTATTSLAPTSTWTSGRISGTIHRYVTKVTDADCRPVGSCATDGAYRRVTVAVTVNGGKLRRPTLASALMADPNDGPTAALGTAITECVNSNGVLEVCDAGEGGAYTAWHLYDTQAGTASSDTRQPVTANHNTHATVASTNGANCTSSVSTGCPRPDLMGTAAPPDTPAVSLFNYSYEQTALRGTFSGGRVLGRETTTCTGTPSADNMKGAMWVSPALGSAKTLTGRGGLSLFTQSLSGAAGGGTLCLAVYSVPGNVANLTSTGTLPTELGRTSYTFESWPTTLTPLNFAFEYGPGGQAVASGRRLGVRVWLSSSSSLDKVALTYDDHEYQSIVQLNEE